MAQLMPLQLTVSCFSKIQIGFTFRYRLTWVVPDKGPLNGCVCVDKLKEASVPKSICSAISIEHRLVTDRVTSRYHTVMQVKTKMTRLLCIYRVVLISFCYFNTTN